MQSLKGNLEFVGATLYKLMQALYVATGLACIWLIITHLNHVQMDLAGHLGSAAAFKKGLFHQFNDQYFLGHVHGLFYPPLEDALITITTLLGNGNQVLGYKLYLALLISAFLIAVMSFAKVFNSPYVRTAFLGGFLWLMLADKSNLHFQGLGLYDVLVIGLSAQILAAIFLLYFLRILLQPILSLRAQIGLVLLGSGIVLSHLVMAVVAAMIAFAVLLVRRDRSLLTCGVWIVLLTAFFWGPFLASGEQLSSSSIFPKFRIWPFWVLSVASMGVSILVPQMRGRNLALIFAVISFGLFTVMASGLLPEDHALTLPSFHYYRLAMPALWLLLIATALQLDQIAAGFEDHAINTPAWILVGVYVTVLAFNFNFYSPELSGRRHTNTSIDLDQFKLSQRDLGRHWIISNQRGIDFGIDSLLASEHDDFRAVKGLYWESAFSNRLTSSYLATLTGLPVVLDYFRFKGYSCGYQACFIENFAKTHDIDSISIDLDGLGLKLPQRQKACFRELFNDGKIGGYTLREVGHITQQKNHYKQFQLSVDDWRQQSTVVPIAWQQLVPRINGKDYLPEQHLRLVQASCKETQPTTPPLIMDGLTLQRVKMQYGQVGMSTGPADSVYKFHRLRSGDYKVEMNSNIPNLFWIKLNYFDGFELRDQTGKLLPLLQAYPGMVGIGQGSMRLTYRRPNYFLVYYWISAVACFGFVFMLSKAWKGSHK